MDDLSSDHLPVILWYPIQLYELGPSQSLSNYLLDYIFFLARKETFSILPEDKHQAELAISTFGHSMRKAYQDAPAQGLERQCTAYSKTNGNRSEKEIVLAEFGRTPLLNNLFNRLNRRDVADIIDYSKSLLNECVESLTTRMERLLQN